MADIIFVYNQNEISIQCSKEENFNEVIKKFYTKIGKELSNPFILYGGNTLELSNNFNKIANEEDKKLNRMKVLILESLQNISLDQQNNIFESSSIKPLYGYEKKFTISNEEIDIGIYLKHMKINIYDRVTITIKEGNYFWNEFYSTPECAYIYFISDKYNCHTYGTDNKVKIKIDKPTKPCNACTYNNHQSYTKLIINRDATVEFRMIDFIENVEIKDELCPGGTAKSIFALINDNSRLFLLECTCDISCSPFINVLYINFGKVFFGNTHFYRNKNSNKQKIFIVGADRGWNWGGKAYIYCGATTYVDEFCSIYDKNNKNIECYKD